MLYAIVAIVVIIVDQWIKLYVSTAGNLPRAGVELIPHVLRLVDVKNDGAAFGFLSGSNATIYFIILAGVFAVLVILALATKFISGPLARWSIVLVTAGAVSNCLDRVINFKPSGYVQDMFQFEFAPWFPVFNLADVFITVFCIIFILAILFGRDRKDEDELEDEFAGDEDELIEEEEVRPSRKARKAARKELDYEDEDDYEDEPVKPVRGGRKARQSRYDEEYEQYKAAQRAAALQESQQTEQLSRPAPTVANPAYNPADPFAEWERANAAQRPAAPDSAPVAQRPAAPAPAPQPARPARPAPTPKPAQEDTSFSLDDILAEFK